ncbi:MAG: 1-deoxy-D-xylulose-5-phosphate reductoisomerase [Actinobacteria bacterium]|nr:1-deoxy-D-xylulose-5-phosphate reductoisomerase [Actinomycetota bacterium]
MPAESHTPLTNVRHNGAVKSLAILGSTGSIGTQALDVVRKYPDRFRVVALAAGRNAEVLAAQVDEFRPSIVVLERGRFDVPGGTQLLHGAGGLLEAASHPDANLVLNGVVGSRGLAPTLAALDAGKSVALANKESLVAGGDLVMRRVGEDFDRLLPVDSEHSALWQCIGAGKLADVRRLLLTASGGPFRGRSRDDMAHASVGDALAHPTWRMGRKISVDSATLMNKGLEAIEAHHLFRLPMDRIDIVVHPQSIVHGIAEFIDGSCLAQASLPDMHLPLQVALAWPDRLPDGVEPLNWQSLGDLSFGPLDTNAFPAPGLAYEAVRRGGTAPAVLNAANEEAVAAFLDERLAFGRITDVVERVLLEHDPVKEPQLDDVLGVEEWARTRTREVAA